MLCKINSCPGTECGKPEVGKVKIKNPRLCVGVCVCVVCLVVCMCVIHLCVGVHEIQKKVCVLESGV